MKVEKKERTQGFAPITLELTIETEAELKALQAHRERVAESDYRNAGVGAASAVILERLVDQLYRVANL